MELLLERTESLESLSSSSACTTVDAVTGFGLVSMVLVVIISVVSIDSTFSRICGRGLLPKLLDPVGCGEDVPLSRLRLSCSKRLWRSRSCPMPLLLLDGTLALLDVREIFLLAE